VDPLEFILGKPPGAALEPVPAKPRPTTLQKRRGATSFFVRTATSNCSFLGTKYGTSAPPRLVPGSELPPGIRPASCARAFTRAHAVLCAGRLVRWTHVAASFRDAPLSLGRSAVGPGGGRESIRHGPRLPNHGLLSGRTRAEITRVAYRRRAVATTDVTIAGGRTSGRTGADRASVTGTIGGLTPQKSRRAHQNGPHASFAWAGRRGVSPSLTDSLVPQLL
jgi:hypothetical protein